MKKVFGKEKGLDDAGLTTEIVSWLEKTIDAYWRIALLEGKKIWQEKVDSFNLLWTVSVQLKMGNCHRKFKLVHIISQCDFIFLAF